VINIIPSAARNLGFCEEHARPVFFAPPVTVRTGNSAHSHKNWAPWRSCYPPRGSLSARLVMHPYAAVTRHASVARTVPARVLGALGKRSCSARAYDQCRRSQEINDARKRRRACRDCQIGTGPKLRDPPSVKFAVHLRFDLHSIEQRDGTNYSDEDDIRGSK
jgi:hypothetical protein